jgi:hypothetical protein
MLTDAYKNFRFGIQKTEQILKLGISGILHETMKYHELLEKLDPDKLTPNPTPLITPQERFFEKDGKNL